MVSPKGQDGSANLTGCSGLYGMPRARGLTRRRSGSQRVRTPTTMPGSSRRSSSRRRPARSHCRPSQRSTPTSPTKAAMPSTTAFTNPLILQRFDRGRCASRQVAVGGSRREDTLCIQRAVSCRSRQGERYERKTVEFGAARRQGYRTRRGTRARPRSRPGDRKAGRRRNGGQLRG